MLRLGVRVRPFDLLEETVPAAQVVCANLLAPLLASSAATTTAAHTTIIAGGPPRAPTHG